MGLQAWVRLPFALAFETKQNNQFKKNIYTSLINFLPPPP